MIDKEYYRNTYRGIAIEDDEELEILLSRSTDIVNSLCSHTLIYFDELSSYLQEQVKKAICIQTEFIYINGGAEFLAEESRAISLRIGSYSVSSGSGLTGNGRSGTNKFKYASEQVINLLRSSGLIDRSVRCY